MKPPKIQEIYAPKDVAIPARLGGGVLKERVIRELPSKRVISYALLYDRFEQEWQTIAVKFVNGEQI